MLCCDLKKNKKTKKNHQKNKLTLPQRSLLSLQIAVNGDLVIRDISWFNNMGVYRCVAENDFGSHSVETFLYPVSSCFALELLETGTRCCRWIILSLFILP